ncbi:MAG: Hsp70 family protein, partial [Pseudomonadota bacterium]
MLVGIDLGTTNSAIAAIIDGEIVVFKSADNREVLPSVIYIDRNDRRLFGHRALSQAHTSPTNIASGFKRHIGEGFEITFEASNLVLNAEECSTEILKQLLARARAQVDNGTEITHAVIGVPAAFNQMQNEATKRAALAAGLRDVKLLQEPIAAAIASEEMSGSTSDAFIVFDLGGGTLDVALVQNLLGSLTVERHEGVNRLGGRDFDRLIVDQVLVPWLLDTFDLPNDFMKLEEYTRLRRVLQPAAEDAKVELAGQEQSGIFVPEDNVRTVDLVQTPIYVDVDLTRERFETLIGPLLDRTVAVCRDLLKSALYEPEDVDRLVFIGGPTRMQFVRDYVSNALGIPAVQEVDPMTAVAIGAAVFGATAAVVDKSSKEAEEERTQADVGVEFQVQEVTGSETARFRLRIKDPKPD